MDRYTVTDISNAIRKTINNEFNNRQISVVGEISNLKISGKYTFLTLKDDMSTMSVIFWDGLTDNKHGDNVEIIGKINYYSKTSNINLIGSTIRMIGIGNFHSEYEKLKNEYESKGYFNNKKLLPKVVKNIGVVTSENGAALHDLKYVLTNNGFNGNIFIYDCIVQGVKCPSSVAAGIKFFDSPFYVNLSNSSDVEDTTSSDDPFAMAHKKEGFDVDVIVITRGGGSFEDLMGFSNPKVIEAIYASKKYTISAVGHEIDNMLSDYVANYRAPTPSVAGEVISSINNNRKNKIEAIGKEVLNIKHNTIQQLYRYKSNLKKINDSFDNPNKLLYIRLNSIYRESYDDVKYRLQNVKKKIEIVKKVLCDNNVNYLLNNGFVVLTDNNDVILTSINDIIDRNINLIHSSGKYSVIVKKMK